MKKLQKFIISLLPFVCLIASTPAAQAKDYKELTVLVPAESIVKFIKPLLPYSIDMGKNFSGAFSVESIENIKITKKGISFAAHINGKDIRYSAKIGKQTASFKVGDVDLRNKWNASLRFDKSRKKLFITPHIEGPANKEDLSQGDLLLDTLFEALSDVEYPLDTNQLKPITAELYDTVLSIHMNISDIYTGDNMLFVQFVPTAEKKVPASGD